MHRADCTDPGAVVGRVRRRVAGVARQVTGYAGAMEPDVDHGDVSRWLAAYIEAWRRNDREQVMALFTADAEYRYEPYEEPLVGAAAIADSWADDPDEPDSWEARYAPVAVDGDTAVAVGTSRYRATAEQPARTYHNCFVLRFAADGRCRELTEWYVREPAPEESDR